MCVLVLSYINIVYVWRSDGTPMFTFAVKKTQPSVAVGGMSSVGAEVKMEPEVAEVCPACSEEQTRDHSGTSSTTHSEYYS